MEGGRGRGGMNYEQGGGVVVEGGGVGRWKSRPVPTLCAARNIPVCGGAPQTHTLVGVPPGTQVSGSLKSDRR